MGDIDEGLPDPRGRPISTSVYFDSDHTHDQVTRRSVSGVLCFFGSTPISWTRKRQGQVATEGPIALRYMLRSLGVSVKYATELCGDNLGMIISCTNLDSELKNKHGAIFYHKLRESAAAGTVNPLKVCSTVN